MARRVVNSDSLLFTISSLRESGFGKRKCLDYLREIIINNTIELEDLPKKIRCPKCGSSDYIRDLANDYHVKDSLYKYKCINCNTYISERRSMNNDLTI